MLRGRGESSSSSSFVGVAKFTEKTQSMALEVKTNHSNGVTGSKKSRTQSNWFGMRIGKSKENPLTLLLSFVVFTFALLPSPVSSLPTLIPWSIIRHHQSHGSTAAFVHQQDSFRPDPVAAFADSETSVNNYNNNNYNNNNYNSSTFFQQPLQQEQHGGPEIPYGTPRFWIQIGIILALLLFAALMAGLTIGIIGLDMNTLFILKRSGTPQQRRYAEIVEPLRRKGHLLLCTLLIGNMMANEAVPILLDQLLVEGSGVVAVIASTALIVLFAEIIPQSVCSRHGLAIAAHTGWFINLMIWLFFPISWPISRLLSYILGNHEGVIYRRSELKELVALHGRKQMGDLNDDEVKIIKSVLDLRAKTAAEIMTPLHDVFMIDLDTVLDRATQEAINLSGFSRIPVYTDGMRSHIVAVLLVKRLLAVDADANLRVRDVLSTCTTSILFYSSRSSLFALLNRFQEGRAHIAAIYDSTALSKRSAARRTDSKSTNFTATNAFDSQFAINTIDSEDREDQSSVCSEMPLLQPPSTPPRSQRLNAKRGNSPTSRSLLSAHFAASYHRPPVIGIVTLEDIIEEIIGEEIIDETDVFVDVRTKQVVPNRPAPIPVTGKRAPWRSLAAAARSPFRRRFIRRKPKRPGHYQNRRGSHASSSATSRGDHDDKPMINSFPPANNAVVVANKLLSRKTVTTIAADAKRRGRRTERKIGRESGKSSPASEASNTIDIVQQLKEQQQQQQLLLLPQISVVQERRIHEKLAPFFGEPPQQLLPISSSDPANSRQRSNSSRSASFGLSGRTVEWRQRRSVSAINLAARPRSESADSAAVAAGGKDQQSYMKLNSPVSPNNGAGGVSSSPAPNNRNRAVISGSQKSVK